MLARKKRLTKINTRERANLLAATLTNDICIDSRPALFASEHNQISRRDKSLDWQRSDILLNVFLAIAVDNLADAESLSDVEKEEGAEVRIGFCLRARRVHRFGAALKDGGDLSVNRWRKGESLTRLFCVGCRESRTRKAAKSAQERRKLRLAKRSK